MGLPRVVAVPNDGCGRPSPCRGRCHVARGRGDGPAGAGPSSSTGGSRHVLERKLLKGGHTEWIEQPTGGDVPARRSRSCPRNGSCAPIWKALLSGAHQTTRTGCGLSSMLRPEAAAVRPESTRGGTDIWPASRSPSNSGFGGANSHEPAVVWRRSHGMRLAMRNGRALGWCKWCAKGPPARGFPRVGARGGHGES